MRAIDYNEIPKFKDLMRVRGNTSKYTGVFCGIYIEELIALT